MELPPRPPPAAGETGPDIVLSLHDVVKEYPLTPPVRALAGVTFEVVVHMATLCAVLWVYRARVASLATGALRGQRDAWVYVGLLVLAFTGYFAFSTFFFSCSKMIWVSTERVMSSLVLAS